MELVKRFTLPLKATLHTWAGAFSSKTMNIIQIGTCSQTQRNNFRPKLTIAARSRAAALEYARTVAFKASFKPGQGVYAEVIESNVSNTRVTELGCLVV